MIEARPSPHPSRSLAKVVLIGTATLLVFLIAIPFVVPHQSLPEVIIVFVSVFVLIAALIAGTAGAYLFLTRSTLPLPSPPVGTPPTERGVGISERELEHLVLRLLDGDEQVLVQVLIQGRGSLVQQELVRSTGFSDAKVSRLLDRLEGRGLVVRERRGMSNLVRLTLRRP